MSDLYDRDIVSWSEQQAALLRRLAAGERLNERVDWVNLIDEVEDLGRSELRACESLLRQALVHLLKLHVSPGSASTAHWRGEIVGFLDDARRAFTPSMRLRIKLPALYESALRQVIASGSEDLRALVPIACPFTPDELLAAEPDLAALVRKLGQSAA